jgi:hypothetical protein
VDSSYASSTVNLRSLSLEAIVVQPALHIELEEESDQLLMRREPPLQFIYRPLVSYSKRHIDHDGAQRSVDEFEETNTSNSKYVGSLAHGPGHSSNG